VLQIDSCPQVSPSNRENFPVALLPVSLLSLWGLSKQRWKMEGAISLVCLAGHASGMLDLLWIGFLFQ
jgi:hypothetical protein